MKSLGSEDIYEPESAVPASDFLIPMDAVQQLLKGTGGELTNFVFFSILLFLLFATFSDKVSDFLSGSKAVNPSQLEEERSILSADIIETG